MADLPKEKDNFNLYQSALPDASNSQTVGVWGPVLLQDTALHEVLEDFVFSTTLPRRIHTKGYGAFGYF